MIHGICCGKRFNCLDIYGILHWSINGECPWCRLEPSPNLTDSQLFAVCTHSGHGWHAPEFRDPGPPIISFPSLEQPFVTCSTEDLDFLDHRDAAGVQWTSSRVPRLDLIEPLDAPPQQVWPHIPLHGQGVGDSPSPPLASTKKLLLACRCNNCA